MAIISQSLDPRRRVILPVVSSDPNHMPTWAGITARQLERETQDILARLSSAYTDLSTLDGEITTAQGDISALETRMTAAESDITALDGRVTTLESEVDALQAATAVFAARVANNTGQNFTNGAVADHLMTSETFDVGGLHSSSNATIVCPSVAAGGLWEFGGSVIWTGNANGERLIQLVHSSAGVIAAARHGAGTTAGGTTTDAQTVHSLYTMTNGQTIKIQCAQTSGGNLATTQGWLWARRVGPSS